MTLVRFEELASILGGRWLDGPPAGPIRGTGIDSREALDARLFVAIRGERFDGHDFLVEALERGAVAAIVERDAAPVEARGADAMDGREARSEGRSRLPPRLLVPSTRTALADLARAWRSRFSGAAAAITGSCGKTTARRLLASILEQMAPTVQSPKSFNNDLGVPLTILALAPGHRFLVAEVGMNRPGEIRPLAELVSPCVALITSIGPVHLEALGSVEAIAREKASIVQGVIEGGAVVFPAESGLAQDAVAEALAQPPRASASLERVTFGLHAGDVRLHSRRVLREGSAVELDGPWGRIETTLQLPGEHNALNAVAAAAVAHRLGASAEAIREGLALVRPSEMRFVRERIGPLVVVNDAYNANPVAMRAAIRAFCEVEPGALRRVVVLGDMLELGRDGEAMHRELGAWLAGDEEIAPDLAVFVGPLSAAAADAYRRARAGAELLELPDAGASSAARLIDALRPGDSIFFKASRGSALERLIDPIRLAWADEAGTAASGGGRR